MKLVAISQQRAAQIIAAVNALFGVLIAFNVVFTTVQQAAIVVCVNALLALFVTPSVQTAVKKLGG